MSSAADASEIWDDTDGIILPYVTLLLVVIVGLSVLALDGSRYMSLQTQLQNGADALALAGAAELDRVAAALRVGHRDVVAALQRVDHEALEPVGHRGGHRVDHHEHAQRAVQARERLDPGLV